MLENTLIFSLSANKDLANKVASALGMEVSEVSLRRFPSGEIIAEPIETVRDKDVYIIQSTCPPVNENLMELLIFVDSLKRSSAREINVIIPYFGYARQDRKAQPRQPITSRLVADLLKVAGVDRVVIVDLHAPQIQGFFSCLVDELTAIPLLGHTIQKDLGVDTSNMVTVSPDHGGVNRARRIAEKLNTPLAIIDKRRTKSGSPEVMNIIGDVKDKDCYIIDDMIDTAGSAVAAAAALKQAGAKTVKIAATHAVLSDPAFERLSHSDFDQILVTDSIPLPSKFNSLNVKVVSLAPMLAAVIKRIQNGEPLSVVYEMYNN
ncbi:MAG TPA: ribose-phosphate pyrophosphokinase [Firmicutes bacterium]|jgi:ribose-phosphate diphosphokinase|nr:ribose-phosphate pyrophosphokinase [Bacillota bacterium]HAW99759.1 ribose-phosphate pyrophosphokinase [Bacillota bacterium]HCY68392.1 ribose-phosphate pyrophosphokinase [Bacillota bacterium]